MLLNFNLLIINKLHRVKKNVKNILYKKRYNMSKYLELVEGAFAQEHLDKQQNQKPYVAYSIKDGKVIYTIIPKEEGEIYTIYRAINYVDISNCTYNMVDLGLPSGLKWADRNVGAKNPEHYGSYFQWGDTYPYTYVGELTAAELASLLQLLVGDEMEVTKDNVGMILEEIGVTGNDLTEVANSISMLNREFNWKNYKFGTGLNFTKYNSTDNLKVLESVDDAATVNMGSNYRTPTMDEQLELIENTTQTFIDLDRNEYSKEQAENGVIESGKLKGVRFTGSNGNSIFIPASGGCIESSLYIVGVIGNLWSSSLKNSNDSYAACLVFSYDGNLENGLESRCNGSSVRGVQA